MPRFCVNKNAQSGGEHEVHNLDVGSMCLPEPHNQLYLGVFSSCREAINAARMHYSNVDGCKYCATACHTR